MWRYFIITAISLNASYTQSFTFLPTRIIRDTAHVTQRSLILTDRQKQFWEDVESGLSEIETVFFERGQNIDRVWDFVSSAQGRTSPPIGYAPKHYPCEEFIPHLTAQPFWDVACDARFPWAKELEESAPVIINEFQSKILSGNRSNIFAGDSASQNDVMGEGWSALRLQRLGVWNEENCQKFPNTYQLLRSLKIPLAVRGVCFARQLPSTGVKPHSDGRNFILTSHLGLEIPLGCWIKVGDETRTWEKGKLTTIDTSFEHSTGNPTNSDRYVLIIDFWHPELTSAEIASLQFIYDLRNKFENGSIPFRKPKTVASNEKKEMKVLKALSSFFGSQTIE